MRPYWKKVPAVIYHADCLDVLATMPEGSVDTVITDPPYHLTQASRGGSPRKQGRGPAGRHRIGERGFMGRTWDGGGIAFAPVTWRAVLRVLKPGGLMLAMGGTRTWHRLACAVEDAGFEVRDTMMWIYAQGFPKFRNISKAVDEEGQRVRFFDAIRGFLVAALHRSGLSVKQVNEEFGLATTGSGMAGHWFANISQQTLPTKQQWFVLKKLLGFDDEFDLIFNACKNGNERPKIGKHPNPASSIYGTTCGDSVDVTAPASPEAALWNGWGTSLKPSFEPILLSMKPLDGTYAENALEHGVAGLNVDGARIGWKNQEDRANQARLVGFKGVEGKPSNSLQGGVDGSLNVVSEQNIAGNPKGRWPANLVLSHLSLTVCVLDDKLPVETRSVIRRYYHGYTHVQDLRRSVEHRKEVLQQRMCGKGQTRKEKGVLSEDEMPILQENVQMPSFVDSERETEILQQQMQVETTSDNLWKESSDVGKTPHRRIKTKDVAPHEKQQSSRPGSSKLEGRAVCVQGIQARFDRAAKQQRADVGTTDDQRRVHSRTPAGDGCEAEPLPEKTRGSTSREREQARQQTNKPRAIPKKRAQPKAQDGRKTTVEGKRKSSQTSGENTPLEVLACDIPSGWMTFFSVTGESLGCVLVGTRRVNEGKKATGYDWDDSVKDNPTPVAHNIKSGAHYGEETTELWACVSGCPVRMMDEQSGDTGCGYRGNPSTQSSSQFHGNKGVGSRGHADAGGASRFFYCAKVSTRERNLGMPRGETNRHPTLKPVDLMRYLCVLSRTPTGGVVLDPFCGSGSTGIAAMLTGRPFIGIDQDEESCRAAKHRIAYAQKHPEAFLRRRRAQRRRKTKAPAETGYVQGSLFEEV